MRGLSRDARRFRESDTDAGSAYASGNSMRNVALAVMAIVLAAIIGVVLWSRSGPSPEQFAYIANPRLTRLPDRHMLVVEARGDPNVVGAHAFKTLFTTYYTLDGVSRGRPPAPRARWPRAGETPKPEWKGYYALPVPDGVSLAASAGRTDLPTSIRTWEYGTVAEILHVGPYADEEADIRRLVDFIVTQGYRVIGDHEEEYVRGPGLFFAGDPEKYLTIIRLRVQAADVAPNP